MLPGCLLGWTLLVLAAIDVKHLLLPDVLTLPLLAAGLLWQGARGRDLPVEALAGAALGGGLLWAVAAGYRRLRGQAGLGLGDAKLLAAAGAWTGWQGLPAVLLGASLSGLLLAALQRRLRSQQALAFGPHLALAGWAVWLCGGH
jgi:leader peptidase (prepilin peptidase)/N-methyltransferase